MGELVSNPNFIDEEHKMIIDEYFVNGFNGFKAVKKYRPHIADGTANQVFNAFLKDKGIQKYISDKRTEVRGSLAIKEENILVELMNWLRADATDFIGLTPQDLKKLPSEVKRCIQSVKHKKTTKKNKDGSESVDEYVEVKIIDKLKALEMINKHINFYDADNQSKKQTVDISKATPEQLNTLLGLMESQLGASSEEVIDLD